MSAHADIATISHDYGESTSSKDKDSPCNSDPLHIQRHVVESIPQTMKRSTKCMAINPNAKATQNYSIVEDLAQIPCVMSVLEVL